MKVEEGIVIEVQGDMAKIRVGRHNDCTNCGACPGSNAIIVDAQNRASAKPGERVLLEVRETNTVRAAFIVFLMPIIAIFIGAVVGRYLGVQIGKLIQAFEVLGGILGFIIALIFIKVFDKSINSKKKDQPVVTRIL